MSTLTVEDLYSLPDDGLRHELVEGRLLSEPLPGARHGRVTTRIVHVLSDFAEHTGAGDVLPGFWVRVAKLFGTPAR